MLKLLLEALLEKPLDKMFKNQNGLALLTTLLAGAGCNFSYANWHAQAALQHDITNIKHAMYYELHINVDAAGGATGQAREPLHGNVEKVQG